VNGWRVKTEASQKIIVSPSAWQEGDATHFSGCVWGFSFWRGQRSVPMGHCEHKDKEAVSRVWEFPRTCPQRQLPLPVDVPRASDVGLVASVLRMRTVRETHNLPWI
jgi:hypothetical protein